MTDKELVHQALDMLKQAKDSVADWGAYASEYFQHKHNLQGSIDDIQAQITVLSERLAQPEQEPATKAGELRAMKEEFWKQPDRPMILDDFPREGLTDD